MVLREGRTKMGGWSEEKEGGTEAVFKRRKEGGRWVGGLKRRREGGGWS